MKKLLVVGAVAALGLTSAFAGGLGETPVVADNTAVDSVPGLYIGVEGGYGMTGYKNLDSSTISAKVITVDKDKGGVARGFIGYDITEFLAVEAGYTHFFNKVSVKLLNKEVGTAKASAVDLFGKISTPAIEGFKLYAKVGASYLMTKVEDFAKDKTTKLKNFGLAYGAGLDYSITQNIIANLEWLRNSGSPKLDDDYQPSTDAFMVGVRYKFEL